MRLEPLSRDDARAAAAAAGEAAMRLRFISTNDVTNYTTLAGDLEVSVTIRPADLPEPTLLLPAPRRPVDA